MHSVPNCSQRPKGPAWLAARRGDAAAPAATVVGGGPLREWRSKQADLPSRAEAICRLVELGLAKGKAR
jgi:hypothetical protein